MTHASSGPRWRMTAWGAPTTLVIVKEPGGTYAWETPAWGWAGGYASPPAAADGWTQTYGYQWHSLVPIPQ